MRVYGQHKYEAIRDTLLQNEVQQGQTFWQGEVALEVRTTEGQSGLSDSKNVILISHEGNEIGELSEFDSVANTVLDFTPATKYSGRVVIHQNFIGSIVHLLVDPKTHQAQQ